jgi:hypothetical protein
MELPELDDRALLLETKKPRIAVRMGKPLELQLALVRYLIPTFWFSSGFSLHASCSDTAETIQSLVLSGKSSRDMVLDDSG